MSIRKIDMAEATEPLAEYARQVDNGDEPVVVTSGGRPIAAVIPITGEEDIEAIAISANPKFMEIIERSRERQAREGAISPEEMRRRLGL